jgi:hypothetical protein
MAPAGVDAAVSWLREHSGWRLCALGADGQASAPLSTCAPRRRSAPQVPTTVNVLKTRARHPHTPQTWSWPLQVLTGLGLPLHVAPKEVRLPHCDAFAA